MVLIFTKCECLCLVEVMFRLNVFDNAYDYLRLNVNDNVFDNV